MTAIAAMIQEFRGRHSEKTQLAIQPPSPFMISDVSSIRFRRASKILHHHFQPGVK
jgi:hypothetical protein